MEETEYEAWRYDSAFRKYDVEGNIELSEKLRRAAGGNRVRGDSRHSPCGRGGIYGKSGIASGI